MSNNENIIERVLNLYNSLDLTQAEEEKIGVIFQNSKYFQKLPEFKVNDSRTFLTQILDNLERYKNPIYFMMIISEFIKRVDIIKIFSKIIVNNSLLNYQHFCSHNENEVIYRKKFSTLLLKNLATTMSAPSKPTKCRVLKKSIESMTC